MRPPNKQINIIESKSDILVFKHIKVDEKNFHVIK